MGSFANTVFSIMLGWLQALVSMIWSALTAKDGQSFLQFIGSNWIKISAVLCSIGLVADFAVYFFRWAPYKVWGSFLRRLKNGKEKADSASETPLLTGTEDENRLCTPKKYFRKREIADDSDLMYQEMPEKPETEPTSEKDDLLRWRTDDQAADYSDISADITKAGYTVPADSPYRKPDGTNRRRKFRINLLGDTEDSGEIHYYSPRPMVDQKKAYHAPVYPEKWTGSREQDS